MNITSLIAALEAIRAEHGDLPCGAIDDEYGTARLVGGVAVFVGRSEDEGALGVKFLALNREGDTRDAHDGLRRDEVLDPPCKYLSTATLTALRKLEIQRAEPGTLFRWRATVREDGAVVYVIPASEEVEPRRATVTVKGKPVPAVEFDVVASDEEHAERLAAASGFKWPTNG